MNTSGIPPANHQTFPLRVGTTLDALSQVLTWFEAFRNAGIPEPIWMECRLALAEGFTNAVRHAHQALPETTPIDIELVLAPQGLELRIWDQGQEFDLEGFAQQLPAKMDTDSEGGRGILLMKALTSRLSYTRQADGRNCLLISKRFNDPSHLSKPVS
ncbi:ATP-binding protein [Thermostichus vulcanus]|uniref:ATP-binding protein n=1 Tax=Thermostichus vulcanus str. 'Rupite' TaxID=2813851 RepID=A0ABT0CDU8_THEVL|nr:ATP-binding protein [Thermostichus vulcanus]MCJ2543946.1 ATP-binding protein [Thermostichus vulcanus str. 'Rupite']